MLFDFFNKVKDFAVFGEQGGIAHVITLPEGFNPISDKCPTMVMMHGFMASKDRNPIKYLAKELAKAGIGSIAFDFNAHGKSEGNFKDMTISNEIADARAVYDYVCQLPYVTAVGFLGHSQGGVVAGMLAGELSREGKEPFCLIQLAPAAVLKDDAIAGQCMGSKYNASDPPEHVNVFFHKLGRKFILEAQKLPIYETSALFRGRVCIIHGSGDKIVPLSYSERYAAAYENSSLHVIDGEGHFLSRKRKDIAGIASRFILDCAK